MDLQTELDLGNQCYINKNYEQAIIHYDRLLAVHSDNFIICHNKGLSLIKLDRLDEAIPYLQLAMNHGYAESWLAYGSILRTKGLCKPNIAIPFFQLATQLNPSDMTARLNLSVAYLMNGDLLNGWKYYDARWFYDSDISFKPTLSGVEYDGTQDINDKIVFVYIEQGLGDCVQFGRYLTVLQQRGAKITFVCRKPLERFFKYNYPDIEVILENNITTENLKYDYHVPLMELPKCFNTTVETIPAVNYSVGDDIINYWYKRLRPTNKKRIGIVWSSNRNNFITRFKNINLETLLKLKSDNIELISLEYDVSPEQTKLLQDNGVIVYGNELGDFYSVAGLMKNLDLVISIDTATVHLSASIGVHTWTLLSDYACDWRWFTNRDDSPFYPLMKLYRQKGKDWDGLIEHVKKDLKILDK